jgi:hypothetical protein
VFVTEPTSRGTRHHSDSSPHQEIAQHQLALAVITERADTMQHVPFFLLITTVLTVLQALQLVVPVALAASTCSAGSVSNTDEAKTLKASFKATADCCHRWQEPGLLFNQL